MTVVRDESHPRPLLARREWVSLDGGWRFAVDHDDRGLADRWYESADPFDRDIRVPFVPESPASGIGDDGPYRVVWYRRELAITTTNGRRVLLHFGAVDQDATVWVDGRMAGTHRGGQTAFRFDVTDLLGPGERHVLTVRVVDDADDPDVPRGKQDWRPEPHFIWYRRSTGIWKTVWLEEVAAQHPAPPVTDSKIRRLLALATNANPKIRSSVASSYHLPEDLAETPAHDPAVEVRNTVGPSR